MSEQEMPKLSFEVVYSTLLEGKPRCDQESEFASGLARHKIPAFRKRIEVVRGSPLILRGCGWRYPAFGISMVRFRFNMFTLRLYKRNLFLAVRLSRLIAQG
jgi:hypothetical protein